jgi:glycosyltransferase involved in cell wall biosynthesis
LKIAFIVSSLEPGRDGVGDYTRRLAGELIRQGNQCRIVSLNDKCRLNAETLKPETATRNQKSEIRNQKSAKLGEKISAFSFQLSAFTEWQTSEGTEIECLRLSGTMPWSERTIAARDWLNDFNPDWVSLQFVPFGFHPKGLCFGLAGHLKSIIRSRPLHWMFHELWVLWSFPLSLRKRLLGQVQKFYLRQHLRKLKPQSVSTQLSFYQTELSKIGVSANVIPLHGNIPVYPRREADKWLADRCALPASPKPVKAGFFGNIVSTLDPELFAAMIAELKTSGNELLVLSAGKTDETSDRLWNSLEQEFAASATFIKLGGLNEREASHYFSALDYGLTSYPTELMGKSSGVAAMREHGLRVISCGSLKSQASANKKDSQTDEMNLPWTVKQSALTLLKQFQTDKL